MRFVSDFDSILDSLRYSIWQASLTVCFDCGWPYSAHRALRNSTIESCEASGCRTVGSRPGEGEAVAETPDGEAILRYETTAPKAGFTGNIEAMCLYSGTGSAAISDIPPASERVERTLAVKLDRKIDGLTYAATAWADSSRAGASSLALRNPNKANSAPNPATTFRATAALRTQFMELHSE